MSAASPRIDGRGQGGANWSRSGPHPVSSDSSVTARAAQVAHARIGGDAGIRDSGIRLALLAAPLSLPAREGSGIVRAAGRIDNTLREGLIFKHSPPPA
jgi:hypothetical protein